MTKLEYKPTYYSDTYFKGKEQTRGGTLLFRSVGTMQNGKKRVKTEAETFDTDEQMIAFIENNNMTPLSDDKWRSHETAVHLSKATQKEYD